MAHDKKIRIKVIALAVASALAAPTALAREETIAYSGMPVPGLPDVTFWQFAAPSLNNAGETALLSTLQGPGITGSNDSLLYSGGTVVFREGDPAGPGVTFGNLQTVPQINDAGQTYIHAFAIDDASGVGSAAVVRDGNILLRANTPAPGFSGSDVLLGSIFSGSMNGAGSAVVPVLFTGTGITDANRLGLYRIAPSGGAVLIARSGNFAPGTGGTFTSFGSPQIDDLGQAVFAATIAGTGINFTNDGVIYRGNAPIAREGDAAPGLGGVTFGFLSAPSANNAGQVAFRSALGGAVTSDNDSAIWRDATLIAREGNLAPGAPAGTRFGSLNSPLLNDAGDVAFTTGLVDPTGQTSSAVYRGSTLIARTGTAVPGDPAGNVLTSVSLLDVNDGGQVAYLGGITPAEGSGMQSLRLSDGIETLEIARTGDTRLGETIQSFFTNSPQVLNDHGQVAYQVTFADPATPRGVFLYTPELRWRQGFGSSWDFAGNWTLGIDPALVHDVAIDPASSLTVTGPSTDRTVRTLEVGGGTGIATLSLDGGRITALDAPVAIRATGVLTGDGAIAGGVLNQGTVRAHNVTVDGGLANEGLVTGNGRLAADVVNAAGGRISVAPGDTLVLDGALHNGTPGNMDVIRGGLEVRGSTLNEGQLLAREATLRFGGGLSNAGRVDISFGTSDVFGSVANQSAGTIVASGGANVTFADDVVNQGEVRASLGSSIVYFGDVSGSGGFLGAGTHFFEGSLSPGMSPGTVDIGTGVFGTDHALNIELGDPTFDHVHADSLFLDGVLNVSFLAGYMPTDSITWDILDWTSLSGEFAAVNLPGLVGPLAWNTSNLYLDGTISVAAIPEPETYALLLAGLGLLGFAARAVKPRSARPARSRA